MERRLPSPLVIGLVIAGLLILVVAGWFFLRGAKTTPVDDPRPNPGPPTFAPPPAGLSTAEDPIELPELDASDELIRSLVEDVSENPRLLGWAAGSDGLVRRVVAATTNVARGESPRNHVPFLAPGEPFRVSEADDEVTIDPRSFDRYDVVRQAVISLDTATSVRLFYQLEPLFDRAYRDLGYPEGSFRPVLLEAIDHILATPIPSEDIELERDLRSYEFADPELEALSAAQKHYLRMGPDNMRQLHAKLRLLKTTLEATPAGAPAEDPATGGAEAEETEAKPKS